MLRYMDSFGWCQFASSPLRYNTNFKNLHYGSGFFNGDTVSMGTLTGSIVPGPQPNSSAIQFQRAHTLPPDSSGNTGWFQGVDLLGGSKDWFVACWVKPENLAGRQTFFWFSALEPPNFLGNMSLAISPGLKLEVIHQNSNLVMNALGFTNVTSVAKIPDGQWTHVCVRYKAATGPANGRVTIWINGALDTDQSGLNLNSTTQISQAYLVWQQNAAAPKLSISNLIICDPQGSTNNTQISPNTQILTIPPTADVDNGNWTPSIAGPNYTMVDLLSGPGATYITIADLAQPDELFSIAGSTDGQVLALGSNFTITNGPGNIEALARIAGVRYPMGSPITANSDAVVSTLTENSPATGKAWTDSEINAAAWGCRAFSGSSEQIKQFWLEKLWTTGIGPYTFGS